MNSYDPPKKIAVLGLDGLSYSLACRLARDNVMPNLAKLMSRSDAGSMTSALPEISPVAWTSLFTAASPGEHGIYGFTEFEPGSYRIRFNSSADVRSPNIWDWLTLQNRPSVVLNVPMTYPASPLHGVMVSGFVALDAMRAGYPPWVGDYLRQTGYRLEADFERVHHDRDAFLSDLDQALAGRKNLLDRFWSEPWDLFVLVVTDTDRLFHFFLGEFLEGGPIRAYFLNFMQRVDELVGEVEERTAELARKTGEEITLIIVSDHGFAGTIEEFHVNRWLVEHGFQKRPDPGGQLADRLARSDVFALDPSRLYFNRPARFPGGRLAVQDIRMLSERIIGALSHEPAVKDVLSGSMIYNGGRTDMAPDLVILPNDGYELKAKFTTGRIYTPSVLRGTHTYQDALYLLHSFCDHASSPEIRHIGDLGGVMRQILGV